MVAPDHWLIRCQIHVSATMSVVEEKWQVEKKQTAVKKKKTQNALCYIISDGSHVCIDSLILIVLSFMYIYDAYE